MNPSGSKPSSMLLSGRTMTTHNDWIAAAPTAIASQRFATGRSSSRRHVDQPNNTTDTAAMAVAQALGAEKLVFLSDVNGVRRDKEDPDTIIHSLSAAEASALIDDGTIDAGMIPKVQACIETLGRGVKKIHIVDGGLRHSLLLEVFTTSGVGTEIHK